MFKPLAISIALSWGGAQVAGARRGASRTSRKEPWYFASTCLNGQEWRDNASGKVAACESGTACMCPRYLGADDSWNCLEGESPCRNIPHATPR